MDEHLNSWMSWHVLPAHIFVHAGFLFSHCLIKQCAFLVYKSNKNKSQTSILKRHGNYNNLQHVFWVCRLRHFLQGTNKKQTPWNSHDMKPPPNWSPTKKNEVFTIAMWQWTTVALFGRVPLPNLPRLFGMTWHDDPMTTIIGCPKRLVHKWLVYKCVISPTYTANGVYWG